MIDNELTLALKALWKTVFGDGDYAVNAFFNELYDPDRVLYTRKFDGGVASALYLVEARLHAGKRVYSGKYIYAAATDPDLRGRGLMSGLIDRAIKKALDDREDFLMLVPGDRDVAGFYARRGFMPFFYRNNVTISSTLKYMKYIPRDAEQGTRLSLPAFYRENREKLLEGVDHVEWPRQVYNYTFELMEAEIRGEMPERTVMTAYTRDGNCPVSLMMGKVDEEDNFLCGEEVCCETSAGDPILLRGCGDRINLPKLNAELSKMNTVEDDALQGMVMPLCEPLEKQAKSGRKVWFGGFMND